MAYYNNKRILTKMVINGVPRYIKVMLTKGKVTMIKDENPTTITGGKWFLNNIDTYRSNRTMGVRCYDSLGNYYKQLHIYGDIARGVLYNGEIKYIYDKYNYETTESLAIDTNGNIKDDYYLVFEEEKTEIILGYLNLCWAKYVEVKD